MKQALAVVIICFLCAPAGAEMYKSVDEDGNVVYSDEPSPDATEIKPSNDLNTIQMPKPEPVADDENTEPDAAAVYETFKIIEPQNNKTIWASSGVVVIKLLIKPRLDLKAGHRIAVYVDGNLAVKDGWQDTIKLTSVDRGAHSISAAIRDKKGETLIRSNSVQVDIKRKSSLHDKQDQIKQSPNTPGPKDSEGNAIKPGPQGVHFQPGPVPPPPANQP